MCYNGIMEEKIEIIKKWLGTGSINILGLPMSGKDTQGIRLAEALGAKFLSSGMIIRTMEKETRTKYSEKGDLIPSDVFYEWILPYFARPDLTNYPLVLSSVGRWHGEEEKVMEAAEEAGHEIKAVIILDASEADVERRFEEAKVLDDRGERADDKEHGIFLTRIKEFREKTAPVLIYYRDKGLLIMVNGDQTREKVFDELIDKLHQRAIQELEEQ